MLHALAALLLVAAQAPPGAAERDWLSTDPMVRFTPDSRMETPRPRSTWTGRAGMTVTCVISEVGAFEDCRVVRETPAGRINVRTAIRAFRHARLDLADPSGPRPGDTITTELVLSRAITPL